MNTSDTIELIKTIDPFVVRQHERFCLSCGGPLPKSYNGLHEKYCSRNCVKLKKMPVKYGYVPDLPKKEIISEDNQPIFVM